MVKRPAAFDIDKVLPATVGSRHISLPQRHDPEAYRRSVQIPLIRIASTRACSRVVRSQHDRARVACESGKSWAGIAIIVAHVRVLKSIGKFIP